MKKAPNVKLSLRKLLVAMLAVGPVAFLPAPLLATLPSAGSITVSSGSASLAVAGPQATITSTDRAVLNWGTVAGGGGGRLEHYKALADRLQLGREVKFLGLVSDVERLYPLADVFILPTLADPCPLSPLEAMAAGVATVMSSSEFNGSAELITKGEALILTDPNDPKEIASTLTALMDGHARASLAEKGRQLVRQLTWDKTAEETLSVYRDVIRMRMACREATR